MPGQQSSFFTFNNNGRLMLYHKVCSQCHLKFVHMMLKMLYTIFIVDHISFKLSCKISWKQTGNSIRTHLNGLQVYQKYSHITTSFNPLFFVFFSKRSSSVLICWCVRISVGKIINNGRNTSNVFVCELSRNVMFQELVSYVN